MIFYSIHITGGTETENGYYGETTDRDVFTSMLKSHSNWKEVPLKAGQKYSYQRQAWTFGNLTLKVVKIDPHRTTPRTLNELPHWYKDR